MRTFYKMDFKEKLLTQLLWNLVQILQGALGQWSDLTLEEINIRKALRRIDINPIVKFGLGPFESPNDQIYESSQFVKEVEANNRRIQGRILGLEIPQTIQAASLEIQPSSISSQKTIEDKEKKKEREEKVTPSDRKQVEGMKTKSAFNYNSSSKALRIVHQELKNIKNQIKSLREMAKSLQNLTKELDSGEDESAMGSVGKVSRIFEMMENIKNKEKNENKNRITDKNGFKGMNNNIVFNNQYQIDGIFIINRLSEGKKPFDSKSDDYKKPDVEIFNELTTADMKKLFLEMPNYLNIFKETETDCSRDTCPSLPPPPRLDETEMKFLREFERNFSRIFPQQNVTREEVNRMIKIIDFVDRYRGTVNTSNPWSADSVKESETVPKMGEDGLK